MHHHVHQQAADRHTITSHAAALRMLCILCAWVLASCTPLASPAPTQPPVRFAPFLVAKPGADGVSLPDVATDPATATLPYVVWTATSESTETSIPSSTETFTPFPNPTLALHPTPPPTVPATVVVVGRTHYTLTLTLDYVRKAVAVNETIFYPNTTGQSLSSIVLAVEPNLWSNCFTLASIAQDGAAVANYQLSGHRLTIYPAQPLAPSTGTTLDLGYSMSLPVKSASGTFGYLSTQVNLTDWYPFIVPFDGDWILHDSAAFGEELVYDAADYDVNLKVSSPNVIVAASAPADSSGGDTSHYHLDAARTFAISASDSYRVDESAVGSVKIRSYYFPGDGDASQAVVWMATQSVGLYQAKFAPYPYQTLSVVESNLNDGQEYDGLVFLSSNFYSGYNGSAKSNLVTIGTHEIAHQWWFGLVGSDQAMEPWLDEALSVYSERIFYQYNYPGYGEWWWNFRVNFFGPSGYVDQDVYQFPTFRSYVDAAYLNGANFLEDLRSRIGDDAFFAFLKDYAATYSHGHATTSGFFAVLRNHTDKDFSDLVQAYFQRNY